MKEKDLGLIKLSRNIPVPAKFDKANQNKIHRAHKFLLQLTQIRNIKIRSRKVFFYSILIGLLCLYLKER